VGDLVEALGFSITKSEAFHDTIREMGRAIRLITQHILEMEGTKLGDWLAGILPTGKQLIDMYGYVRSAIDYVIIGKEKLIEYLADFATRVVEVALTVVSTLKTIETSIKKAWLEVRKFVTSLKIEVYDILSDIFVVIARAAKRVSVETSLALTLTAKSYTLAKIEAEKLLEKLEEEKPASVFQKWIGALSRALEVLAERQTTASTRIAEAWKHIAKITEEIKQLQTEFSKAADTSEQAGVSFSVLGGVIVRRLTGIIDDLAASMQDAGSEVGVSRVGILKELDGTTEDIQAWSEITRILWIENAERLREAVLEQVEMTGRSGAEILADVREKTEELLKRHEETLRYMAILHGYYYEEMDRIHGVSIGSMIARQKDHVSVMIGLAESMAQDELMTTTEKFQAMFSLASSFTAAMTELGILGGEESFRIYKATAIAEATVAGILAIQKTWATLGLPLALPFIATIAAITAANVARIARIERGAQQPARIGGVGGAGPVEVRPAPTPAEIGRLPLAPPERPPMQITIHVAGFIGDEAELATELGRIIREAQRDGVEIVV